MRRTKIVIIDTIIFIIKFGACQRKFMHQFMAICPYVLVLTRIRILLIYSLVSTVVNAARMVLLRMGCQPIIVKSVFRNSYTTFARFRQISFFWRSSDGRVKIIP